MIEELVNHIERLFKELLEELKNGNIEVKKAQEISGFNPTELKKWLRYFTAILIMQIIVLIFQIYVLLK